MPTIAIGFFAGSNTFVIVGAFPPAVFGVPYDQQLAFAGEYATPVLTDAIAALDLPPGLVLETSVDGMHARLHGTPEVAMTLTGVLDIPVKGVPYSSRLQIVGSAGNVVPDISAGALPPWASLAWHSDTNEIEVYGTPT